MSWVNPAVLVRVSPYDLDGLHLRWRDALARQTYGKILPPFRFVLDGIGQQRGGLSRRAPVAELDELRYAVIIGGVEVPGIHCDYGIGQNKRAALILQDRNAEGVGEDAAQSFQLLASTERHA